MKYFFSFIAHTKVAKVVLSGEPDNFQPFGNQAKGLFLFSLNYFSEKEGFLIKVQYVINKGSLS